MKRAAVVLLVLCVVLSRGMIQKYSKDIKSDAVEPGKVLLLETSMFSLNDTPYGFEQPYVSLNLTFHRETTKKAYLDVFVYQRPIDKPGNYVVPCCNPSKCNFDIEVNNLSFEFKEGQRQYSLLNVTEIFETGVYVLQILNCPQSDAGVVLIEGTAEWRNPYGYLPGEVYVLLPLSGALAGGYAIISLFYLILCIKYRKELMKLQWGIFGVLAFGMIEIAAWCFYRVGTNDTGYYSTPALLFVVFLANVKKTVSRVLALLVSMGLGVVKWTLGTTRIKIGLLAIFYMFFSFLFQTIKEVEALAKKDTFLPWVTLMVIIPAAILDTSFYYWIILSLIRTIQQITLRRQVLKLQMYKIYFGVLVVAGILSGAMIIYQGYLHLSVSPATMNLLIPWQNVWMIDAFWEILFFCVLTAIAILWRPRSNNTRYGYDEYFKNPEEVQSDDKNIPLESIRVTGLTQRKKQKTSEVNEPTTKEKQDSEREKYLKANKLKITDFEKDILSIDLPSDEENEVSLETQIKKMD